MKKTGITLLILAQLVAATAFGSEHPNKSFNRLIKSYSNEPGFTIVNVDKVGLDLAKSIMQWSDAADDTSRDIVSAIRGLKSVSIVEFEDCPDEARTCFSNKLESELKNAEMLMSVNDDNDHVRIYGWISDKENILRDLIIYVPTSSVLIYLDCTLDTSKMGISEQAN